MHIQNRARFAVAAGTALAVVAAATVSVIWADRTARTVQPAATVSAGRPGDVDADGSPTAAIPAWSPGKPSAPTDVHLSWAYLDSTEGGTELGGDRDIHELDGLATPAIVQDYLNQLDDQAATFDPDALGKLTEALHGDTAQTAWVTDQAGGRDAAVGRAVAACSLADTKTGPVRATALDVARLAACLREGAITQPTWAEWTVTKMRANPGGIGDVRGSDPQQHLAQTNSTVADGDRYRTGCLAIGAYWSAGIFVDYPAGLGEQYGVQACADVARTVFPPDMQQVPGDESPAPATNHA